MSEVTLTEVLMPRLSDSMEEGTIVAWLKGVGDPVAVGEALVEIETDKATMIWQAEVDGVLSAVMVDEGESVPVGQVIAAIGRSLTSTPGGGPGPRRVKASPVARRLANSLGIDLTEVVGSGSGGRITRRDIEDAARRLTDDGAGPPAERADTGAPRAGKAAEKEGERGQVSQRELTKPEAVVAKRMAEAKTTIPHFYVTATADAAKLEAARAEIRSAWTGSERLPSINDVVVKASALALAAHPNINVAFVGGRLEEYSRINVGFAVADGRSLVVPVVKDANRLTLRQIAVRSHELVERVRAGATTPGDVSGGTFTVSNLGMYGVTSFQPIVNPPEAAILAVGGIEPAPYLEDGLLRDGRRMALTLACDHRAVNGAEAAEFLRHLAEIIEEPLRLAF